MTLDPSQSRSQDFRNKPPGKGKGKGQPKGGKGKVKGSGKGKGKGAPPEATPLIPKIGFLFKHKFSASIVAVLTITHITVTKSFHAYVPRVRTPDLQGEIPNLGTIPIIRQIQLPPSTFEQDEYFNHKKKGESPHNFGPLLTDKVNGRAVETILDSGASMSVVAASLMDSNRIKRTQSVPVQVVSGETIFTMGTTDLELNLGGTTINFPSCFRPRFSHQTPLHWHNYHTRTL